MNTDIIQGKWKQIKGEVRQKLGKLTDSELTEIEGNAEKLIGKLQEHYGWTRQKAQEEVDRYLARYE